jgi:hypothetical protein
MDRKLLCSCGTIVNRTTYFAHLRTKKHKLLLENPVVAQPEEKLHMKNMESKIEIEQPLDIKLLPPRIQQCECGGHYTFNKHRHLQSKMHRQYITMQTNIPNHEIDFT